MADSVRLAVLKALTDYLSTEVTVVNGYAHTLTNAVFRGRFWFGEDDPLPMVSILEGLNPDREPEVAGYARAMQKDKWILLLQGWVSDDRDNPTDPAHNLLADVKAALGKLRRRIEDGEFRGHPFGELEAIGIEPGTVRPPDQLSERAFFWVRIVLSIVETMDDPFYRP